MLPLLYKYTGPPLFYYPSLYPSLLKLTHSRDKEISANCFNYIVSKHIETLSKTPGLSKEQLLDLLIASYFRYPLSGSLKNFLSQFSNIFQIANNSIRLSRSWISAIQAYTETPLFPQQLFALSPGTWTSNDYAAHIHYIHQATYNILHYKKITPTLQLIYRNSLRDSPEVTLKGTLTKFPVTEYDTSYINKAKNIRCCSIKPHACENYDFDYNSKSLFVLLRGMDDVGNNIECVLPTVLFTFHHFPVYRYKGNVQPEELLLVNHPQLRSFFWLFEPNIPAKPVLS